MKRPDVYIISFTSFSSPTLLNEFRAGRRRSIDLQYPPANRPDAVGAEALKIVPIANGVPFQVVPTNWSFPLYGGGRQMARTCQSDAYHRRRSQLDPWKACLQRGCRISQHQIQRLRRSEFHAPGDAWRGKQSGQWTRRHGVHGLTGNPATDRTHLVDRPVGFHRHDQPVFRDCKPQNPTLVGSPAIQTSSTECKRESSARISRTTGSSVPI